MNNTAEVLFGAIPEAHALDALEQFQDIEVPAGAVLMEQDAHAPSLAYLVHGAVAIQRDGTEIDTSGPGEILGEMGMFRGAPRTAQVIATRRTRALILEREGYEALVRAENPVVFELERRILAQLAHRLRRLDALVTWLALTPSGSRETRPVSLRESAEPEGDLQPAPKPLDPAEVLAMSPLFREDDPTWVNLLATRLAPFTWTTRAAGQVLFRQGAVGDAVYLLAEGTADVLADGSGRSSAVYVLGTVGPGDAVGMTAALDSRPRMAHVVATTDVQALVFERGRLHALVRQDNQASSALRRALIRAFSDQLEEAGASFVTLQRNLG